MDGKAAPEQAKDALGHAAAEPFKHVPADHTKAPPEEPVKAAQADDAKAP